MSFMSSSTVSMLKSKKIISIQYLFSTLVSLFILVSVCFILMHAIPGDPFQDEQGIPEEVIAQLKERFGLDKPIYQQYGSYILKLFQLDFGTSIRYSSQSVQDIIVNGFPISMRLGLQAMSLAIPLGIALGLFWAWYTARPRKKEFSCTDTLFSIFSTLLISTPNFVIAALLQFSFAIWLPLFPVARWGSGMHTILPTVALAIGPIAMITRIAKARATEIAQEEWILMARMKGLSELNITFRHILPHVAIPIFSYLGPIVTNLLVGSFAIERVFGIPGLGQWFVNSILTRDYPVISGLILFYAILLFSCHLMIDCIIRTIDRRDSDFSSRID